MVNRHVDQDSLLHGNPTDSTINLLYRIYFKFTPTCCSHFKTNLAGTNKTLIKKSLLRTHSKHNNATTFKNNCWSSAFETFILKNKPDNQLPIHGRKIEKLETHSTDRQCL